MPEYRLDRRCQRADVRHHHDHITRVQRGLPRFGGGSQQSQQLVVQDFQFAHRAVGNVEDDGPVLLWQGRRSHQRRVFGQRRQIADPVLHLPQQRCARHIGAVIKQIDALQPKLLPAELGVIKDIELSDEVAPLPTPGRQHGMGMGMHRVQRHGGQITAITGWLAAALRRQQLAPIHDVAPMKATGVGDGQQHLAVRCQCHQRLQGAAGHLAHAERHDPPRHAGHRRHGRTEVGDNALMQGRPDAVALRRIQCSEQGTPQGRLPELLRRQWDRCTSARQQVVLALRPSLEPIRTVVLVLVKQVGQTAGQLQHAIGLAGQQKAGYRRKNGFSTENGQQLHQPPDHRQFVQGRLCWHGIAAQHLPVGTPQKAGRQLDPGRSADVTQAGHLHLDPFRHTVALHQNDVFFERRQGMAMQPVDNHVDQVLRTIAVERQKARRDGGQVYRRHGWQWISEQVCIQRSLSPLPRRTAVCSRTSAGRQCKTPTVSGRFRGSVVLPVKWLREKDLNLRPLGYETEIQTFYTSGLIIT